MVKPDHPLVPGEGVAGAGGGDGDVCVEHARAGVSRTQ